MHLRPACGSVESPPGTLSRGEVPSKPASTSVVGAQDYTVLLLWERPLSPPGHLSPSSVFPGEPTASMMAINQLNGAATFPLLPAWPGCTRERLLGGPGGRRLWRAH